MLSDLAYTFVFCPRHRRQIFRVKGAREAFQQAVNALSQAEQFHIQELTFLSDAVLLSVSSVPADTSPLRLVSAIKKETSKALKELPELSNVQSIWTRDVLIFSDNHSVNRADLIHSFIDSRKKR